MAGLFERTQCPGCGGARFSSIYSCPFADEPVATYIRRKFVGTEADRYLSGHSYRLMECADCALVFQHEVCDDELAGVLYDRWLNRADPDIEHSGRLPVLHRQSWYAQEILKVLRVLGKPPQEIEVLDYGMGWGWWCLMAKSWGCRVTGLDLSQERVEFARAMGVQTVDLAGLRGRTFDFVNTEQVFEHLTHPLDTLRELSAHLKPGGLVKLSVPDGTDIERRLKHMDWSAPRGSRKFLIPATPLIHINTFSAKSLGFMAKQAGLVPKRIPLAYEYSSLYFLGAGDLLKLPLRPIFRRIVKRPCLFFEKPATAAARAAPGATEDLAAGVQARRDGNTRAAA